MSTPELQGQAPSGAHPAASASFPPVSAAESAAAQPSPTPEAEPRSLRIEDWLTVGVMAALALITFTNVLVRYFTNSSFAWTEEISVFLMIVLALVAGSAAVARNQHIRIEYFAEGGTPARRRALARFGAVLVALLFTLIAVLSVRVVWDDYRFGETSPGIGVPQWWYSMWLPILSAAIAARAIGLFVRQGRASHEAPTEIIDPHAMNTHASDSKNGGVQ